MQQAIIDFDQDELGDWRAILACGHRQHVRHNPPFVNRPWVLTAEGRDRFLGARLECKACDEGEPVGSGAVSAEALEDCYNRFRQQLRRYLLRRVAAPEKVEGVLRDAFLAIHDRVGGQVGGSGLDEQVFQAICDALCDCDRGAQLQAPNAQRPVSPDSGKSDDPTNDGHWVAALWDCVPGIYRQACS